ncbi:MAG TPA: glycosyltransferase family 1 protein [Gammaproteobacteria bacterium]|nr:glycosyltransferase family 1 protein [Gammaproteobacteria bacterium]
MKKRLILFLLSNFRSGGAETQYGNLIRNIDREKFIPVLGLIHYRNNAPTEKFLERFGDVEKHSFYRKGKFDISVITSISSWAKNNNIDLIQSQLFMDNQIARLSALLARLPVVTSVRGEIGPLLGPRKMWFEQKAQIMSNKIVVNSDWLRRYLVSNGSDNNKIVVIHNGVDYSRLEHDSNKDNLRKKYNIPADNHVITIVARLHPMKDHITFLDAIKVIKNSLPNITVLVIGDGTERSKLEGYTKKLQLNDTVNFLGNVEDDINEIYGVSNLLMLTSQWGESFPNVILEAMFSRVPVVASDISAVNEIIDDGENGFLVNSKDVNAFSKAALSILEDKSLSEKLSSAGRHKSELFNIPVMVKKYEDMYQSLLSA